MTLDDVGWGLMFMHTPMTEEGVKGESQCAITDYVNAGMELGVICYCVIRFQKGCNMTGNYLIWKSCSFLNQEKLKFKQKY